MKHHKNSLQISPTQSRHIFRTHAKNPPFSAQSPKRHTHTNLTHMPDRKKHTHTIYTLKKRSAAVQKRRTMRKRRALQFSRYKGPSRPPIPVRVSDAATSPFVLTVYVFIYLCVRLRVCVYVRGLCVRLSARV